MHRANPGQQAPKSGQSSGSSASGADAFGYWSIASLTVSAGLYLLAFNVGQGGFFDFSGCLPLLLSMFGVIVGIFLSLHGINKSKTSLPCWVGLSLNVLPIFLYVVGMAINKR